MTKAEGHNGVNFPSKDRPSPPLSRAIYISRPRSIARGGWLLIAHHTAILAARASSSPSDADLSPEQSGAGATKSLHGPAPLHKTKGRGRGCVVTTTPTVPYSAPFFQEWWTKPLYGRRTRKSCITSVLLGRTERYVGCDSALRWGIWMIEDRITVLDFPAALLP